MLDQFASGLYLINCLAGPEKPKSACMTGISWRVPGLWSLRCPVIQPSKVASFLRKG